MGRERRDEGRPELGGDAPLPHAGNIGVMVLPEAARIEHRHVAPRMAVVMDDPGQVVVTVDEWQLFQQRERMIERRRRAHP